MKQLFSTILLLLSIQLFSQPHYPTWQRTIDGDKTTKPNSNLVSCTDINGNLILAGLKDSGSTKIIFIKKINDQGLELINVVHMNFTSNYLYTKSITSDIQGNIYLAYWNLEFVNSTSQYEYNVMKCNSQGQFIWSTSVIVDPYLSNFDTQISVDSVANIYFAMMDYDTIYPNIKTIVGKILSNGTLRWQNQYSGSRLVAFQSVNNNLVSLVRQSDGEIIAAQIDSSGLQTSVHSDFHFYENSIAKIDNAGNVFITAIDSTIDSMVIYRLDPSLNPMWRINLHINYGSFGNSPLINSDNSNVYVVSANFGWRIFSVSYSGIIQWFISPYIGTPISIQPVQGLIYITSDSTNNALVSQFDPTGNLIHSKFFSGAYEITSATTISGRYYLSHINSTNINSSMHVFSSDQSFISSFDNYYSNIQSNQDHALKIEHDFQGNIITVAMSRDTILPIQDSTGAFRTNPFGMALLIIKYDTLGNELWRNNINLSAEPEFTVEDLHVDLFNNIYICGTCDTNDSNHSLAYLLKLNQNGQEQWRKYLGNPAAWESNIAYDIETYDNGNIFVCGSVYMSLVQNKAFLALYDSNGVVQNINYMAANTNTDNEARNIARRNNRFATILSSVGPGFEETYINEYNELGFLVSSTQLNNGKMEKAGKVTFDNLGNFICYAIHDSSFFGSNWIVMKYDSLGNLLSEWDDIQRVFHAYDYDFKGLVDSQNNFYMKANAAEGNSLYQILKLDQNCNLIWRDTLNVQHSFVRDIELINNTIYATGWSNYDSSLFFTVYDSSGTILQRENISFTSNNARECDLTLLNNSFYVAGTTFTIGNSLDILTAKYGFNINSISRVINENNFELFPVPTTGRITIQSKKFKDELNLTLYSVDGKLIWSEYFRLENGSSILNIPMYLNGIFSYTIGQKTSVVQSGVITVIQN